ncbi:MAG: recombination-associated protein RdgC [Candidatus Adiutrix sp.]|jgi:DNA recombination-dependent growth factor C|nr:recombination-associated protein RdgC [Candidatus Adiutrix sp.]
MGLIKGTLSLTRYRVREEPPEMLTDEYITERLAKNAFVDIEHAPEERSLGWVEFMNHLDSNFNPATYRFGGLLAFTLRLDTRKLSPKAVSRYYIIREAQYQEQTGRRPNSLAKKELKEAVKSELMRRTLLSTELMEVVWLFQENEIWLAAAGEKRRETFEELWGRSFGLSLQMLVPVTTGLEVLSGELRRALLDSKASPVWLG